MALQSSVNGLTATLMGIGDRNRAEQQTVRSNAMQDRYQKLAQSKFDQEVEKSKKDEAMFKFQDLTNVKAVEIAKANNPGKPLTDAMIQEAKPMAAQQVFRAMGPGSQNPLGKQYRSMYGTDPSRQLGAIPNANVPSGPVNPNIAQGAISPLLARKQYPGYFPGYKPPTPEELAQQLKSQQAGEAYGQMQ